MVSPCACGAEGRDQAGTAAGLSHALPLRPLLSGIPVLISTGVRRRHAGVGSQRRMVLLISRARLTLVGGKARAHKAAGLRGSPFPSRPSHHEDEGGAARGLWDQVLCREVRTGSLRVSVEVLGKSALGSRALLNSQAASAEKASTEEGAPSARGGELSSRESKQAVFLVSGKTPGEQKHALRDIKSVN